MSGYGGVNAKMSDVVRTVAVITLGLLALFLVARMLFSVDPERPTSPVDYLTAAEAVEPSAGFVPLVPEKVPGEWYANSARFDTSSWEMGVVTDDEQFIGLRQIADEHQEEYEDAVAADAAEVSVGGQSWQLSESGDELVYARNDAGVTTLLTSSTDRKTSERYLSSLVPLSEVESSAGEAEDNR